MKRLAKLAAAAALGLFALHGPAQAQAWPSKTVRWVNPFPPGGSSDALSRLMAEKLTVALGQPVIVDNRAGSGGLIGGEHVARSEPDGHTILLATMGMLAISPSLYAKMTFDPATTLTPVIEMTSVYNLLVVNPDLPIKTVPELIGYAKANPGRLTFASAGNGSSQHLAGELFKKMAGVDMLHIPYRGGAPALVDLMSRQVSLMFGNMPELMAHVQSGKLRAVAFGSAAPSPALPALPTIGQTVSGFSVPNWFGLVVPAGTPKPIVDRLNAEVQKALDMPDVREKLTQLGFQILGGTPEKFRATIAADTVKWAEVVRFSGARID
jgi:tripartite-type tricarboxylate transporter receptor subunit TctC